MKSQLKDMYNIRSFNTRPRTFTAISATQEWNVINKFIKD